MTATTAPKSTAKAYLLAAVFFVASCFGLVSFLRTVLSLSSGGGIEAFQGSPVGVALLFDYLSGAIFMAMFLWLRDGPAMLGLSPKLIALLFPLLFGNFLPYLYIAFLLVKSKDVVKSFLRENELMFEPPIRRAISTLVALTFISLFVVCSASGIRAILKENMSDSVEDLKNVYILSTLMDVIIGLLFPISYIYIRERGVFSIVFPWIFAAVLLGNIATCLYVVKVAHESLQFNSSFRYLLLSRSPRSA